METPSKVKKNDQVVFTSKEGTRYIWKREEEKVVLLSELEILWLQAKVQTMSDMTILNRKSGNGIPMGIPIQLGVERLKDIKHRLIQTLAKGPLIGFSEHVIERVFDDSLLDPSDPNKRGWTSTDEVRDCVLSIRKIEGARLNVDHEHPSNTHKEKYLHPYVALEVRGKKDGEKDGRLILVIVDEKQITVITIL